MRPIFQQCAILPLSFLILNGTVAAAPNMMGYSGRLVDDSEMPYTGRHNFVARIFDAQTGGALIFEEEFTDELVDAGYFYLLLANNDASGGELDFIFATLDALYLELEVDGTTLSPRQRITSTPWALGDGPRLESITSASCTDNDMLQYDSSNDRFYCGNGGGVDAHTHHASDIDSGTVGFGNLPTGTTDSTVAVGNHGHNAGAITSGTLPFGRLPTGTTGSTVAVGNHGHDAGAITSGTLPFGRLPTGTTGSTVAVGNHGHNAGAITSGTLPFGRLPTGTTASTVAVGDHSHAATIAFYSTTYQETNATLLCPGSAKVTGSNCLVSGAYDYVSGKGTYPLINGSTSADQGEAPRGWRCHCSDSDLDTDLTCRISAQIICVDR